VSLIFAASASTAGAGGGKTVDFEGKQWATSLAKEVIVVEYKGKKALHILGGEQTYVYLPGVEFQDGVIELDIAGPIFSGVGFRGRENGRRVEKIYFRPQNAGTAKHANTVQYAVLGREDGTWRYLRTKFPGKYETGADIKKGEWFHVKLVIRGTEVKVYVDEKPEPVLTVDKMLDGVAKGTVGVWGWNSYFANFRFTPASVGPRDQNVRRRGPGEYGFDHGSSGDKFENVPLAKDEREKKVLAALDEMEKGRWHLNVATREGRLLRQLTEAIGAKRVVEIGTSSGYSTIWMALAVRRTGGKIFTHEIDPEAVKLARENFRKAGVEDLITIIEGDAHETIKQHTEPIDIVFLDAKKQGYPDYLAKLLPLVRPGGLILGHDMNRPRPDPRYIEAITKNPDLATSFVMMEGFGISVTLKKR